MEKFHSLSKLKKSWSNTKGEKKKKEQKWKTMGGLPYLKTTEITEIVGPTTG